MYGIFGYTKVHAKQPQHAYEQKKRGTTRGECGGKNEGAHPWWVQSACTGHFFVAVVLLEELGKRTQHAQSDTITLISIIHLNIISKKLPPKTLL